MRWTRTSGRGSQDPHPEPNLDAFAPLGKDDLAALYRGLTAAPTLHDLLAKD